MKALYLRVLIGLVAGIGLYSRADAFEFPSSHAMALGRTSVLSNMEPSSFVSFPGSTPGDYSAGLEIGYNRKYDLRELDRLFVAGATRWRKVSAGIGLLQMGQSGLYVERTVKGTVGIGRGNFTAGITPSVRQVEFGEKYGRFNAVTVGAGVGYRSKQLFAALALDDLTRPKYFSSAEPQPRRAAISAEWKTARQLSTCVMAEKIQGKSTRYGLGQRIPLAKGSALYWGVSTAPVEYGGGLDVRSRWVTFTYAATIHPVLGLSHNVSVAFVRRTGRDRNEKPEREFE